MQRIAAFAVLSAIVGASAAQATDKLGSQFTVVDTDQNSDEVCNEQTTAGLRDDKFVVYFHCTAGQPGDEFEMYDAISGRFFSRAGKVLKNVGVASYNELRMFGNPAVAGSPSGKFVVLWEDSSSLLGSAPEIAARRFNAAGVPSSETFVANTTQAKPQTRPAIAMFPDDSFVALWVSGGELWRIMGQRFGPQGEYSGPEFQIGNGSTEAGKLRVAGLTSGRVVALWDTAFRIFTGNGRLIKRVVLATPRANVAGLKNGRFVMVWSDDSGVYGQLYDAAGAKVGSAFQVSANVVSEAEPVIAGLTGGGFVVAWRSNLSASPIAARVYNARANPIGAEFRVDTEFLPDPFEDEDWDWVPNRPSIAALSSGGFVVTYQWTYGIKGQRFAAP